VSTASGSFQQTVALPESWSETPASKSTNSRAADGSAARFPKLLNRLLPG
jgi:hypothetical protein